MARQIEALVATIRAAPNHAEPWGKLGCFLMHSDLVAEAGYAFDTAEKLAPTDVRWVYLHAHLLMPYEPAAVAPLLRRAVATAGDKHLILRLQLGLWLVEHGEFGEAEEQFQALLRQHPGLPPASLGLARVRHAQGRLEECRGLISGCLADAHTAKAAHLLLAQVEQSLGNTAAAATAARQAAKLGSDLTWPDPFWAEAANMRIGKKAAIQEASLLMDQGEVARAIDLLKKITRDYAADDEGWYLLGWAFNRAELAVDAEGALREHLRRAPGSPKGRAQLAVSLLRQKRATEAIDVLEEALKLKPTWRELHFNLGYACVQLGREDEAIGHLRAALALDPNFVPTYTALAELLMRRRENAEALRLLRQALELDPADSRALALVKSIPAPQ